MVSMSTIKSLKIENDNKIITDLFEISIILNNQFKSVFSIDNSSKLPNFDYKTEAKCDLFNLEKILEKIKKLDPTKAIGPDKIHGVVLKNCGEIPELWKYANVTPLHKGGSKLSPKNYRPVSLSCISCKIFVSLVNDFMLKHLLDNNLISNSQHEALANGYPIDIIYTNFAKAFDKVSHRKLLFKLKYYGFGDMLIKWIKSYLSGGKQRVVLGETISEWVDVESGVPQGLVLGPLLFIIYINDMLEIISNSCEAYADDTKILSIVFDSIIKLQNYLDNVCKWSKDWSAELNVDKCKIIHIGNNNTKFD
ncbi:unnamed protein product [Brachionus calyciflorus]|uniref:Reverse transcriptase domain-containing protein n=1 Tax=Brachionus calyciflorus TaxID=104777 RepID=A0A814PBI1_9BILA|nr:unnamed protein product [Brachionus calyciflorus]